MKRDQNWSGAQTASAFHNSNDRQVPLQESIPVYMNYFTVWVNDDGSMSTFRDLYGHDARMAAALLGEPMPYEDEFPFQAAESFPVTAGPAGSGPASWRLWERKAPTWLPGGPNGPATLKPWPPGLAGRGLTGWWRWAAMAPWWK
jgi:hypothetical protein